MSDSQKTKTQLLNELQAARAELQVLRGRIGTSSDTKKQTAPVPGQSEDKFYNAFLSSPDMIIITSISTGKYIEVNESFVRNTGYSREELIGHTVEEYNMFATKAERDKMDRILKEKNRVTGEEFNFRTRSGETRQWLCSMEVINIEGEACALAVAADITERKKMQRELLESQQILSTAFRMSPQAIGITSLKDGNFLEVNESHTRLSGYTREEMIGHTALELKFWDDLKNQDRILHKLVTMGRISNEKIAFRCKSGEIHKVLFSAELISIRGEPCMIGSSTDITGLEEMEQALQVSEDKFTRVFSSSPTAICLFSVEDQIFQEVNDSFMRFTGYCREEVIGRTADDLNLFVSDEEKQRMSQSLTGTGVLFNERIQSRMKSGEIRTGLFSAQGFDISGKKHMILSINDITDQVKAQSAIANEAILRRILVHDSKDGIVILDDSGKVFEANRRFAEMLGYSAEEMAGLYVWDWDTQWDRANLLGQIRAVTDAGDHFETLHKRKDGTVIDVEISTNGAVVAGKKLVFCVCRDITARKQMEKALRESEEKFSKAFLASPESMAITTLKDEVFLDVNENYTLNTGFTREELIGHTIRELNVWVKDGDRKDMFKTLKEKGRVVGKEYEFRTKAGDIRTWLFSAEPIDISGEKCLMGAAIDITERKQIEAKALEAENLREVDRLRRELLANVSHELRTPLASIKGFMSMLMDYGKRLKPGEKQEYMETIDKSADRLVELIEQLLEMSRLGAGMLSIKKVPTDVVTLCHMVIDEARTRSGDRKFTLDLPVKLPQISIDERRIHQVLDNLIDNAVKYSETGTEVKLSVRRNSGDLLFTVSDHGSGISAEEKPLVFDRLFSAQKKQKSGVSGAGLGLSICKGLIEAHDGKIWFESKEGVGTSFFFTLPVKSKKVTAEETTG